MLRNPLASPTTLGVASGAQLALMMVTLFAPSWLLIGREWIAMAGGSLAMGLVFALAWRRQLNPVVIVFAGLVINLYLAAISMGLLLFFQEELKGLLVWGSGSLAQNSWSGVLYLLPRLLVAGALAALLVVVSTPAFAHSPAAHPATGCEHGGVITPAEIDLLIERATKSLDESYAILKAEGLMVAKQD